ncbi:SEC-C domain-containing protein [bacterium]|nr:SEC-C domain-containing protein [bacterium]
MSDLPSPTDPTAEFADDSNGASTSPVSPAAEDAARADRLHRATIEFGLDSEQAELFETAVDAAMTIPDDITAVVAALADPDVAEAVWTRWGDIEVLGPALDGLIARLDGVANPNGGTVWLTARHEAWHGRTSEAVERLERAAEVEYPMVLIDLAATEADRSNPLGARDLLVRAGIDVDIDLDAAYDPHLSGTDFGAELAEEVAPFAAMRPPAMAGRNERCPCGSGTKYKHCHLGNELHPLTDRAGWLYVKLMRFMQVNHPQIQRAVADDIVESVVDPGLRSMVHESYLGIDLALFEGGIAERFLHSKRTVLPADEAALLQTWIDASRTVLEVKRSRPGSMDVVDLATRVQATVVDTVPEEPIEIGWKVIGRLVPVGDSHRAYGGFLPVNDDMVTAMLDAFSTRELETATIALGQIFDTATTQDEIQDLFAESLDTGELSALLKEMGSADGV